MQNEEYLPDMWAVVTPDRDKAMSIMDAIELNYSSGYVLSKNYTLNQMLITFSDGSFIRWIRPDKYTHWFRCNRLVCDRDIDEDILNAVILPLYRGERDKIIWFGNDIGSKIIIALNEALAHKRGEIVLPSKTLSNDGLIDRAGILKHRCKVAVEAFENYDDFPNCDYAYVVPVKYILEAEKFKPKTGYWIIGNPDNGESDLICGECGKEFDFEVAGGDMLYWLESDYKFCSCCGTRMFVNHKNITRNAN